MASKADFTEEEWKTMQKGVTGAGALVSIDIQSVADKIMEREQSGSTLIRDLTHVHGTGFGLTASREKVETETLDALRSATSTLQAKAPDELAAYQELVIGVAEHVASAKSGIKPSETEAVAKIKDALGATP